MSVKYFSSHLEKPFKVRKSETDKIRDKFPGRVPVLIDTLQKGDPKLTSHKFLVPSELTVSQLKYVVRKRIRLKPEEALFFFYWNPIRRHAHVGLNPSQNILDLYAQKRHRDGYLYIACTTETTFGTNKICDTTIRQKSSNA